MNTIKNSAGLPSKTGEKSGGGRDNNPPSKKWSSFTSGTQVNHEADHREVAASPV